MHRLARILALSSLLLAGCATVADGPRRFEATTQGQGAPLGRVAKLYILHAEADGYDPLRRQAGEIANVIERQLVDQGYATARGTRSDVDPDELATLRRAFESSGASHVMTISVRRALVRDSGTLLRYDVDIAVLAPTRAPGSWRYHAKLEDAPGQRPADLAQDLIRAMQAAGLSRAAL